MVSQGSICQIDTSIQIYLGFNPYDATFALAQQACRDSGKHLCRDEEWLESCEGEINRRWPYGSEYETKACNDHGWVDNEVNGQLQRRVHSARKTPGTLT